MRREGRAHGMVRTMSMGLEPFTHPPRNRIPNKVDIAPAHGSFVKVPSKPSNHSKYTGIYDPYSKSKSKNKGTYKLWSVSVHHKVIGWTADDDDNIPVVGYSASRILNDLHAHTDDHHWTHDYDDDDDHDDDNDNGDETSIVKEVCRDNVIVKDDDDDVIVHGGVTADDDGDDGCQGFYDISGMFCRVVDDDQYEGWSIVN